MKISIVIITYNSGLFIKECIESLFVQSVVPDKIIVVDNNSKDETMGILNSYGNKLTIISLKYNSGYSEAANIGIKNSMGNVVIISNPDVIYDNKFIKNIKKKFETNPEADMISPLILRFDEKRIDSTGQFPSLSLFVKERGYNKKLENFKVNEDEIFSVCGACTVFKRESLEKLKLNDEYYDEDFFIFWEDFDIGWRAELLGLRKIFFPGAIVYHYRSGTIKKTFISKISLTLSRRKDIVYHIVKNRYLTLIKNFRLKRNFYNIPFILIKDILWLGFLILTFRFSIIRLLKDRNLFKKAYLKRKIIKENE